MTEQTNMHSGDYYVVRARARARRKLLITVVAILVVGVAAWRFWATPTTPEVGMCMVEVPTDADPEYFDCASGRAGYRIVVKLENVPLANAVEECHKAWPAVNIDNVYAPKHDSTLVICLARIE